MKKNNLYKTVEKMFNDYLENGGEFTPMNPAIMYNKKTRRYSYGSSLLMDKSDVIVVDLEEGLATWEPDKNDDLDDLIKNFIKYEINDRMIEITGEYEEENEENI